MPNAHPGEDGWSASKVFDGVPMGYGFDDLILMPGKVLPEAAIVDLGTRVTRGQHLKMPVIAGARDSVTEADMAVSVALIGGMGVIHRNQTIEAQSEMVRRAKRYLNGFIFDPVTLKPTHTIADALQVRAERGFAGIPITENGQMASKLLGLVTSRDLDSAADPTTMLQNVMIPVEPTTKDGKALVVAKEPVNLQQARDRLKHAKKGKLPIVDEDMKLVALVTRADVVKAREYPDLTFDKNGQLVVGASVSSENDQEWTRARSVAEAGTNILFLDVTIGDGDRQISFIKTIKAEFPGIEVVVGPVSSCRTAKRFAEAGADAIRVGSAAPGLQAGNEVGCVGRAEATAVFQVARYVQVNFNIPVIADGGVTNAGQVLKALCLGASSVMLTDMLAGTDEAPRKPYVIFNSDGGAEAVKVHHGIEPVRSIQQVGAKASASANPQNELHVPAPATVVPTHAGRPEQSKGSARSMINYTVEGVKAAMMDLGLQSIPDAHKALNEGDLKMECRCTFSSQVAEVRKQAFCAASHPEIVPMFTTALVGGGLS